jgi:hypothetical protein
MDASQQTSLDSGRDQNSGKDPKDRKMGLEDDNELGIATTIEKGEQKYNRLGWKRLTICMIVEAVALGSLSIPSAFATLGLVPGVLITVGLGLIAIYTSYLIGLVKLKYPEVAHYHLGPFRKGTRRRHVRRTLDPFHWLSRPDWQYRVEHHR